MKEKLLLALTTIFLMSVLLISTAYSNDSISSGPAETITIPVSTRMPVEEETATPTPTLRDDIEEPAEVHEPSELNAPITLSDILEHGPTISETAELGVSSPRYLYRIRLIVESNLHHSCGWPCSSQNHSNTKVRDYYATSSFYNPTKARVADFRMDYLDEMCLGTAWGGVTEGVTELWVTSLDVSSGFVSLVGDVSVEDTDGPTINNPTCPPHGGKVRSKAIGASATLLRSGFTEAVAKHSDDYNHAKVWVSLSRVQLPDSPTPTPKPTATPVPPASTDNDVFLPIIKK